MKHILIIAILMVFAVAGYAQNASSPASQSANLNLSNAIDIVFKCSGGNTGDAVDFDFKTVNDFANGKVSDEQDLIVRSNKKFNVNVKTNSGIFSYKGAVSPAPTMLVYTTLSAIITENKTGGSIAFPFSTSWYFNLTSVATNLINGGSNGGEQKFSLKYKADPGWSFPAGLYTVDVVYTATQQ